MHDFALCHLTDSVLLRDLAALVVRDRTTTASLLAHVAEVDARKLYVPAGYPSMFSYCVDELRLSEDAAAKRIHAARAARRFPALFDALAEGRLHLAAICLLAPHLTPDNFDELIEAATLRKKSEIEALIARRFTAPQKPDFIRVIPPEAPCIHFRHAPGHAAGPTLLLNAVEDPAAQVEHAPGHVELAKPEPERYLVQVTIPKSTHDKLRYVQALLSHAVPCGDVAQVLDRALDALIPQLERQKFGAPRRKQASRAGIRSERREESRVGAAQKRESARAIQARKREAQERVGDVLAGLRSLGCRASEARRAAEFSETLSGASLEVRMRAALEFLGRKSAPNVV